MERESLPRAGTTVRSPRGSKRGPWRLLIAAALVGASIWAGVSLYPSLLQPGGAVEGGALTYEVVRDHFQVTVVADGNVESASNIEVKCRIAGGSTILWIVEDGKLVEEGEEIVRLDSSAIDDKLNSQKITYEKALATQIQAQEDLEAAKISVREYEEGTFVQSLQQAEADIRIALENLRSAENQLQYSEKMVRKGFVSALQRQADEFAVERAKLDLDAANTRKKVLVEFTKPKTMKDLEAKREAAAAKLRSEEASLKLEKARLDRFQEQLKNCVITAPTKGMVVYANDRGGRFGPSGSQTQIEEGTVVREGQGLVRLPDLSKMQVSVLVHESHVDKIHPGLPAKIVIQDEEHAGNVLTVANQPQPTSFFSANVKEYATTVAISGDTAGLRPGMTARVTILVDDVRDAVSLPVSAVVEQKGRFFCWANGPNGPERRPLTLGRTNDKLIEVIDGAKVGDVVFRNPRAVVAEARQEPPFEKQAGDFPFDKSAAPAADAGASPSSKPAGPGASAGTPEAPTVPGAETSGVAEKEPAEPGKRGPRSFDPMQADADGDGKLGREEVPERMAPMFDSIDSNGDGYLDASELGEMRRRFSGGRGGPGRGGGGGGGPGGQGEGGSDAGRPPQ